MNQDPKEAAPEDTHPPPHLGNEVFQIAIESAPNAMIVIRGDGTILVANLAAQTLFGYEVSDLVGQPVEVLVPSGLHQTHRRNRKRYQDEPTARPMGTQRDLRAVTYEGAEIPVEIGLSPVDTPEGLVVICAIVDISIRKQLQEELAEGAAILGKKNEMLLEAVMTDNLTSLRNRQAFMDHLDSQLEISVRHARPMSVLFLDIDNFKDFNDTFGHLAGDEALAQVGKILKGAVRRSDFVARLGGEEFGIILPETDEKGARVLAERFRAAIESADWSHRPVTASLGAMTVGFENPIPRPESPELSFILGEADRALYRSKEMGRNRVTHVSEMDQEE